MYKDILISGKKCYLSPIEPNDIGKYREWLGKKDLSMNLKLFNSVSVLGHGRYNYAVIDIETKELIGNGGFISFNDNEGEVAIYFKNKDFYENDYGIEALNLLLDYTFKTFNLNHILIRVYGHNIQTINYYENIGFTEDKERRLILQFRFKIKILRLLPIKFKQYYILYYDITKKDFYKEYTVNNNGVQGNCT
ncbi:MAG: GNAT family N-acetyltransferase [Spirochaetales bacterium]|jgi:RimJ/RimL family protein N-acetyltransferase|nr:GNAT family N-acetyltransferase [Spirochaetales bacterium]